MSAQPYPPPYQDAATLSRNLCVCETTIDSWVKLGLLPPPRLMRGKRLWKWSEVERYIDDGVGAPAAPDSQAERIRDATRKAAAEGRTDH